MRCFYGMKPNPLQDLPAHHAALSKSQSALILTLHPEAYRAYVFTAVIW
jgi:hypothetical protein